MFKKIFSLAALVVAVGFVLYSCSKDKGSSSKQFSLEVTPSSVDSVAAPGEVISFNVNANGDWRADSDQSWITFDPFRGDESLVTSFKATVAANPNETVRSAKIIVSMEDDKSVKKEITVIQKPLSAAFTYTLKGKFIEDCKGVMFCWNDIAPAIYHEMPTILKDGDLTISMPNSHVHIFFYDGYNPGYHEHNGDLTFIETPTVPADPGTPLCGTSNVSPQEDRDTPHTFTTQLKAGGHYWTTHTLENDNNGEGYPKETEVYEITFTFTPKK